MDDGTPWEDAYTSDDDGGDGRGLPSGSPAYWPTDSLGSPYQFEPQTPSARKQTTKTRVIIATAAVLVAGAVGLVAVKSSSGGSRNEQTTVAASVNRAFASKTASLQLTTDIATGSGDVTATGPGLINFTTGALSVNLDMHVATQTVSVALIYLGGSVYEKIPGIEQVEPGKSWITMDLSGIANSGTGALSGGSNPAAMLGLLTQRGAVVTSAGDTTIEGVPVRGYQVTISHAMIEQQLNSSDLPAWMRAAAEKVSFSDAKETVYIDSANQLRRFVTDMTVVANGQSESVTETMDLSNYGVPAAITAPPAGETVGFEQFLRAAQGGLSQS